MKLLARDIPRLLAWALLLYALNTLIGLGVATYYLIDDSIPNQRAAISLARSLLATGAVGGLYLAVRTIRRDAQLHQQHCRWLRRELLERTGYVPKWRD